MLSQNAHTNKIFSMMHGFSSIYFYYLFLDMVFTYDDAQRPNSPKEKLFSLLVFFLANYKVGVTAEKVDEHCFLFGVELRADTDFLASVVAGVEGDRLNRLSWFEVAAVPLRFGRLFGEAI
jgi:hypothetical protein